MVVIGEWPTPPLRTLEKELNACGFVKDLKVLDNATVSYASFIFPSVSNLYFIDYENENENGLNIFKVYTI